MKKYLVEFISTLVFVFIAVAAVTVGSSSNSPVLDFVVIGAAFALIYAVVNKVSVGFMNPLLLLGALVKKKISGKDFGLYLVAELVGAFIGSLLFVVLMFTTFSTTSVVTGGNMVAGFDNFSSLNLDLAVGAVIEVVLSCLFVFMFMRVCDSDEKFGAKVAFLGLVVALGYMLSAYITGSMLNPAKCLGIGISYICMGDIETIVQAVFVIVFQFVGAGLACLLLKLTNK